MKWFPEVFGAVKAQIDFVRVVGWELVAGNPKAEFVSKLSEHHHCRMFKTALQKESANKISVTESTRCVMLFLFHLSFNLLPDRIGFNVFAPRGRNQVPVRLPLASENPVAYTLPIIKPVC